MKAQDGRRLSHEALEQLRIHAVLRVEAGESPGEVIESIGFERVCIVRLSEVLVWRTMARLGLSPQRPLRRAYQQISEAVRRFIENEYPKIKAKAKAIGAHIYWGDEGSDCLRSTPGRRNTEIDALVLDGGNVSDIHLFRVE